MSFFKMLSDFFDSIFRSSSPEVQKKMKLKKIDSEIRSLPNGIYRNGLIQPNFAEVLRILYVYTRPILQILESTIAGPDIKRNTRFEFQLIISAYPEEHQTLLKQLEYEERKKSILLADLEETSAKKIFDEQYKILETLVHELNTKELIKIDQIFVKLKQLTELCKFNFITPLKTFDANFNSNEPNSKHSFSAVAPIALENVFLDLYYIIADFKMTMPVADAVIALAQIFHNNTLSSEQQKQLINNLKKIEYACNKILTANTLRSLIQISKQNPDFEPTKASYSADARQKFSAYIQEKFTSDENRIKRERKDDKIKTELNELFDDITLLTLNGYNADTNEQLLQNSPASFSWIIPLQILKSFVTFFYPKQSRTLLDDIVIEGFFNNPTFKSQFSQTVFSANEIDEKIQAFEDSFKDNGKNSENLLYGYIRDSHKDSDFQKKLISQVNIINDEAKQLIQKQVNALHSLYVELSDLLQDAKKPACEIVSNLKVLMMSTRNRDNTDFFENTREKWKLFFEIMRNYAIITSVEKK